MYLVSFSIYFKHRNIFVSVDFIPWWMSPYTFCLQKLKKEFFRILFNSQILQFFFLKKKKPKKTPLSQPVSPIWYTHLCYTYHVSPENRGGLHVLETELAQVYFGQAGILLRVRAGIPCGHFEAADL